MCQLGVIQPTLVVPVVTLHLNIHDKTQFVKLEFSPRVRD